MTHFVVYSHSLPAEGRHVPFYVGKVWITNEGVQRLVFPDAIPPGWKRGRR